MKRYGELMEQIVAYDNLLMAFHNAAKGKADRKDVYAFRKDLSKNILQLQTDLKLKSMKFGEYAFFTVKDPKLRTICAAAFRERVAHHALMNVCGPLLDKSQIFHSYACRKGKGQHRALAQASRWAGSNRFYLKMDISKFFHSIDHDILKAMLFSRIKDRWVLSLLFKVIDSYQTTLKKGVPLGNLTSQYFANFYLNRFDHWIKQEGKAKCYLRYMDDMLVTGDKKMLCRLRDKSRTYLDNMLGLTLKNGGEINRTDQGIGFLGAVVYPGRLRMNAASKKRIAARRKQYEKLYKSGRMDVSQLQERTAALWAGLYHVNSFGWRKNLARKCVEA